MDRYKYLIFDAQYFLTRNFKLKTNYRKESGPYLVNDQPVMKDDKPLMRLEPNWSTSDLITVFFQSIAKFVREVATADKIILCWDKYPYHKFKYLEDYKGDRHYETEADKEGLDPVADAEKIIEVDLKIEELKRKQEAKYWIVRNFGKIGLVSYIKSGYEADDYAAAMVKYLYREDPDAKVGIVSIDSDWDYWILPNAVRLRPKGGKFTTYDYMINYHKSLIESGLSLFKAKAFIDSAYGSHNYLKTTVNSEAIKSDKITHAGLYKKLMEGDTSYLADKDLFKAQLKSFDFEDYPEYENVSKSFYYLDKSGSILDALGYASDTELREMLKVKDAYYLNFAGTLNPKLYNNL